MKKEDKIVNMAYDDTIAFLLNNKKTDKWKGKNVIGYICGGHEPR